MFVVVLTYQKPLELVDRCLAAHLVFLDEQYQAGTFLLSGRRVPRTGGVILAQAPDRASLQAVLEKDPFYREGLAHYETIEFQATRMQPALEAVLGGGAAV